MTKPRGQVAFLHFIVPTPPPGLKLSRVVGVTTGCGYRIRAWSVMRKDQEHLFA